MNFIKILDWSEFWALLIPVSVILFKRKFPPVMKPVVIYCILFLFVNFAQTYIWKKGLVFAYSSVPGDNIIFYNAHSIIRFFLFSWFFYKLRPRTFLTIKKVIPVIYLLFIIINYFLFQKFLDFGALALGMEVAFLLCFCLLYYWSIYEDDSLSVSERSPEFYIVTGLSIYVVINFPLFLWYNVLSEKFEGLAVDLWSVHNISYVIFCIFMGIGLYKSKV